MNEVMSALRAATLRIPRLIFLSVSSAKKRSTWLSHDELVGSGARANAAV
jgi:hypothetical protein